MPGSFSDLLDEFKRIVLQHKPEIESLVTRSPNVGYKRVVELASLAGSLHGIDFQVHFPVPSKLRDIDKYGTENLSVVIDKFRKRFPIPREDIKARISEGYGSSASARDAYMYEGKEGLRAVLSSGRIEILPGSVHFWCQVEERATALGDWLMSMVYQPRPPAHRV